MNLFRDDWNRLAIFLDFEDEVSNVESDCDGVTITLTEEIEHTISLTLASYLNKENALS